MIGVPPFFYEFLEYIQDGGVPEDFRPSILGGSRQTPAPSRVSTPAKATFRMPKVKRTRKVSRYQKVFGKHLKSLKRKHPRTSTSVLMKRAHRLTKRELK
jgi:hypothetical protein